jgi:hypothetical protein
MTTEDIRRMDRFIAVVLVAFAAFAAGLVVAARTHANPPCTHGASSIGPVTILDGHLTGDTTPHTEACLP